MEGLQAGSGPAGRLESAVRRRSGPGDLLLTALREAEAALEPGRSADSAVQDLYGTPEGGMSWSGGAVSRSAGAAAGGSAAALERRVAAGVSRETVAVRSAGGGTEPERGGWDLAELDRRVQRDARRYDGGLGMF